MGSRTGWLLITAVVTSACASVPMATKDLDAAAKRFAPPPPDRAHIYVFRNESFGAAVKMDLTIDHAPAGVTVAQSFTLLPVRPGRHLLQGEAENSSDLQIVALPGVNYFVWQEVKMGVLFARNQLHLVAPSQGQAGVRECDLIAAPPPPLPPLPVAPRPPAPVPVPVPPSPEPPAAGTS